MTRETLDEAIDRVASALTAVPPDPGFARRLDTRLTANSSGLSVWMGASAIAMVVVAAVVISLNQPPDVPSPVAPLRPAAVTSSEPPAISATAIVTPPVAPGRQAPASPLAEVIDPFVPALAALPTPELLNVDALTLESLTIAPVEFGELDLASLEVRDIAAIGESKEQ